MYFTDEFGFVYQKIHDNTFCKYRVTPIHAVVSSPSSVELRCVIAPKPCDKQVISEVIIRLDENKVYYNTTDDVRVTPRGVGEEFCYNLNWNKKCLITEDVVLLPVMCGQTTKDTVAMLCCVPKRTFICDFMSLPNTLVEKQIQYALHSGDQMDLQKKLFRLIHDGKNMCYIDIETNTQYTISNFDPYKPVVCRPRVKKMNLLMV